MVSLITFIVLYGFWVTLSGIFDLFHLSLGAISCALVTFISRDLLFSEKRVGKRHLLEIARFIRYLPWLVYQIVLANIYVAKLVLHSDMLSRIDPRIIRFKVGVKGDLPVATFANSITLTPGTITVLIQEGFFYVHSIDQKVADDLLTGEMEDRVHEIFREDELGNVLAH
jgi:multicomponent Na+:H+ antiporter subunit E